MAAATSIYISRVMIGCVVPATVDSPVRPAIGSGIATITSFSTMSEGDP